jgi:hypothetical protein
MASMGSTTISQAMDQQDHHQPNEKHFAQQLQ